MNRAAILVGAAAAIAGVFGWRQANRPLPTRINVQVDSAGAVRVEVSGLKPDLYRALAGRMKDSAGLAEGLALYVAPDTANPVAGEYQVANGTVSFRPFFPLMRGVSYEAVLNLDHLRCLAGLPHDGAARVARQIRIPDLRVIRRTSVTAIYPTAESLPANTLRFYVEFSHPMREGEAAQNLTLVDDAGRPVPHAFLGLETELWDASRRRLTVLLDPGRIKRGLRPNQELGSPLVAGKRYRLRIDSSWRDADGAPLRAMHEKRILAGPADRRTLDASRWEIIAPSARSIEPAIIRLPTPVDYVLAHRLIGVTDSSGAPVHLTVTTTDAERTVRLVPDRPWGSGKYEIMVGATLEDVAGNNLQRAFDVDLADQRRPKPGDPGVVRKPMRPR